MPLALTPRLLRRGLELFAVISLIGVLLVLVFFGENLQGFLSGLANLRWGWCFWGPDPPPRTWTAGGPRPGAGARPGIPACGPPALGSRAGRARGRAISRPSQPAR